MWLEAHSLGGPTNVALSSTLGSLLRGQLDPRPSLSYFGSGNGPQYGHGQP